LIAVNSDIFTQQADEGYYLFPSKRNMKHGRRNIITLKFYTMFEIFKYGFLDENTIHNRPSLLYHTLAD
jgi:hypothetical protein